MPIDDTTLIAYLDGQLPDNEYAPLEALLKSDSALYNRLQALADSSELARRAFDPVLLEPVPPHLIAAIGRAPDPRARTTTPGKTPAIGAPRSSGLLAWLGLESVPRIWPAIASVAVLGLGVVIGGQLLAPPDDARWALREGAPVTDPALAMALDVSPSGRSLKTAGGAVEILASFEQVGGGHCREFHRSSPGGSLDELGIACRSTQGHWQLDFLATEKRSGPAAESRYQTASDLQHEHADRFLRGRVKGESLLAAEEQALIERGWSR